MNNKLNELTEMELIKIARELDCLKLIKRFDKFAEQYVLWYGSPINPTKIRFYETYKEAIIQAIKYTLLNE